MVSMVIAIAETSLMTARAFRESIFLIVKGVLSYYFISYWSAIISIAYSSSSSLVIDTAIKDALEVGSLYEWQSLMELTAVPQYFDTGQPIQLGYLSK